jgi:hypothetical protein
MKKSFWVIFGIVLFVLALIIVLGIFLLTNRAEEVDDDRAETASAPRVHIIYRSV